jgi:AcrR family transcriptional regulator
MTEPPYLRIAAEIRRRITAGELSVGVRVPSTRQLTREFGVAMATAAKALAVLGQDGYVQAVPRVGTIVVEPANRVTRKMEPEAAVLGQQQIVAAAIEIADRDGLGALSMRGIAAGLGVPTMSLYRHVRGKDDLILAMIDAAFGSEPFPQARPRDWRVALEVCARVQWAVYRKHPWVAQVVSITRPQPASNLYRVGEWNVGALEGLGLDQSTTFDVHLLLTIFVRGVAIGLLPEAEAEADTGMTGDEWADRSPAVGGMLARFPALSRLASRGNYVLDLDTIFEFGLRQLLDGLEQFVRKAPSPGSGSRAGRTPP